MLVLVHRILRTACSIWTIISALFLVQQVTAHMLSSTVEELGHSMKMIPPKFRTGCSPRMSLQKTRTFHVDDAAEAFRNISLTKQFHFIHAASPRLFSRGSCIATTCDYMSVLESLVSHKKLLSNCITKLASSTALHQSQSCRKCDHMLGKKVFRCLVC